MATRPDLLDVSQIMDSVRLAGRTGQDSANSVRAAEMIDAQINGSNLTRAATNQVQHHRNRAMQHSIAPDYLETREDDRPLNVVAAELRQRAFQGVSERYLREQLADIVARGNGEITYATAARILERSQDQRQSLNPMLSGFERSPLRQGTDLGDGRMINQERVNNFVREITNPEILLNNINEFERLNDVTTRLEGTRTAAERAQYELQSAEAAIARGDTRLNSIIDQLRSRARMAAEQYRAALQASNSGQNGGNGTDLTKDVKPMPGGRAPVERKAWASETEEERRLRQSLWVPGI